MQCTNRDFQLPKKKGGGDFQTLAHQIHNYKGKLGQNVHTCILIELKGEITLTNMYSLHSTTTIVFIHPVNVRKSPVCPKHIMSQWWNITRRTNVSSECMLVHTCQKIKYENTTNWRLLITNTKMIISNDSLGSMQIKKYMHFRLKIFVCYIYLLYNKNYSMYYVWSFFSQYINT